MALTTLFFLLFFIGIGSVYFNKPLTTMLKAKDVAPSPLKSFGVVFPQVGAAGNASLGETVTKIKVSIYIRGVDGSILPGRAVKLSSDFSPLVIEPTDTQMTNNIGQAEFIIYSSRTGTVKLTATDVASNTNVVNIPTVDFVQ